MDKTKFSGSLDSNAIIVEFNDHAGITGYTSEEVIGKNWFDIFIHEQDKTEVQHVFSSFFYGNEPHQVYDNCITCKDGTKKLLQFNNHVLKNTNEEPEFILFTAKETEYVFITPEDI